MTFFTILIKVCETQSCTVLSKEGHSSFSRIANNFQLTRQLRYDSIALTRAIN